MKVQEQVHSNDYVLTYCSNCEEEYQLPEGIEKCPICDCEEIEEV